MAPVVTELAERRRAPSELIALFEQRALDPDRFVPDPQGLTVYDKHTSESFAALVQRGGAAHAAVGLQAAAGPADRRDQRAGVRLRPPRDDHQRLGGVSAVHSGYPHSAKRRFVRGHDSRE